MLAYGLNFARVETIHIASYVKLDGEVSDFIKFCRKQNVDVVFYEYSYYNREEYTVTDELLSENTENKEERNFCSSWVAEYNQKTKFLDYDNPCGLTLCASLGSVAMCFNVENEWMTVGKTIDVLTEFLGEHEDELLDFYEYESGPSLLDELIDILLSDKTFRFCTNKESRSSYIAHFMEKEDNKRFWVLTKGAKNKWDRRFKINEIVNQIYNEYRNRCYRLKIQVGEELPEE